MSLDGSRTALRRALRELWLVVAELVLSTNDDQPEQNDLVSAENVAQLAVEIQGKLAEALTVFAATPPQSTADALRELCAIEQLLREAALLYWRELRAHGPSTRLHGSTRRRGGAWPSWYSGVEQSLDRCEDPFAAAGRAVHAVMRELAAPASTGSLSSNVTRRSS